MQERALLQSFWHRKVKDEDPAAAAVSADTDRVFTSIFEDYYSRIFNYTAYRVSCRYTAEDLTSQVFEKTWSKLHSYSPEKAPFEVWLFAIARNVVNDYYRSRKRNLLFPLEAVRELVSGKKTPDEQLLEGERNNRLGMALDTLTAKERNIVALKFGADLKNTEIASLTGISESNVGVILYRSMKKLKAEIGSVEQL
ncbi:MULTISPECIES: sigma-70 family RNA polymerase sigma factor [unclassified Paenibacillus]|uniref:sigma-70 family RNA polymerase sigma factor n=1 Tax=unclassified Paenibacillus TaxID=185978 RepID=UPI002404AF0C|nr:MULTISPECIES: sigma-70 family RNA polymerase sigma factor [unclassified Paenibacillus]MDF9842089.1 RNA polymerase sigma-70 factor (TIGR02952 family) [Paenibacillus sp. PastF-2]MDF9848657.1 RNA polymerase sigma-70 factor (TIGR02952 family) [Paenibacillus sp. PastM-2]MDF9855226.1 RNA polymerase sigma-70 factor (TIGR02952 family) [Paenibacillus sp. PastF-1]MDH6480497.1 RNA polymerase sigma-70 factor (TIGR02952 family) [Paenibacillus sp. PastH-2]MDH6507924.1 RNA polymerase sigma-70 factor (TIGR